MLCAALGFGLTCCVRACACGCWTFVLHLPKAVDCSGSSCRIVVFCCFVGGSAESFCDGGVGEHRKLSNAFSRIFLFEGSCSLCASCIFTVSTGSLCAFVAAGALPETVFGGVCLSTEALAKYAETFAGRTEREFCTCGTEGALFLFNEGKAGGSCFCCFRRFNRSSHAEGSFCLGNAPPPLLAAHALPPTVVGPCGGGGSSMPASPAGADL